MRLEPLGHWLIHVALVLWLLRLGRRLRNAILLVVVVRLLRLRLLRVDVVNLFREASSHLVLHRPPDVSVLEVTVRTCAMRLAAAISRVVVFSMVSLAHQIVFHEDVLAVERTV